MSEATSIQIVLPPEMAALVRAKIASGEYASASEVVQDGLLALRDKDDEMEGGCGRRWPRVMTSIRPPLPPAFPLRM